MIKILFSMIAMVTVFAACSSAPRKTALPANIPESGSFEEPKFVVGGDISFLPEIEAHGGIYSDEKGERDPLEILHDHGFNAIRLKLWHTPAKPYNDLHQVLKMAERIKWERMDFLLDIHYSDDWADPQKQIKPAAWDSLSFGALVDSVYLYSYATIAALKAQGTVPEMVQVGNEIRPGMLWPDGQVDGEYDTPEQWDKLVQLLSAGRQGILDAAGDEIPEIMIHFDNGCKNEMGRNFFDHLVDRGLQFDVIGLSFYPKWHGTLGELKSNLADLSARYAKDVFVVETSYPWTFEWQDEAPNILGSEADLHEGYPPTIPGQVAFLSQVNQIVRNVPDGRGRGIYYWSPEWIAVPGVPSHWENATLFDFEGKALPSLDVFK